jgi:prophage regulatory protein
MMDKIKPDNGTGRVSGSHSDGNTHRLVVGSPTRLITQRELRGIIPFTPQHILRLEKKGRFPRRVRLGENRVVWLLSEIEAWIAERMAARDGDAR